METRAIGPEAAAAGLPHVVIVGGGFGGLYAARELRRAEVRLTLVDRQNHHLFQPLLYQVATAALAGPNVAAPIRRILRGQERATVLLGEVTSIEIEERCVVLDGDERLAYDYLILAAGNVTSYFGHEDWARHAPGLKTLEDAFEVRRRVLLAFERAERERRAGGGGESARALRFVVVGAGPTGVELAGALREIAVHTLAREFRHVDTRSTEILLVEADERVLGTFPEEMSRDAAQELEELHVDLRLGARVQEIDAGGVVLSTGERIDADLVLWAAGVAPSPLVAQLGCETTRGRALVTPDLSLPGRSEVFVVGDVAAVRTEEGGWVPGMAPGAIQMGRHAARSIRRDLLGREREPFRYVDRGLLATIGRSRAVAEIAGRRFSGFFAWLLWVVVHIYWLVGFPQRLLVVIQWAWAWLTWQRPARVLFGASGRERGTDGD